MSITNTVISLKKSAVPGNVPTSLANGEIAINTADGILFYKSNNGVIRSITSSASTNSFSTINVNSTLLIATSGNDILTIDGNGAIYVTGDSLHDKITINVNDSTTSQKGVVQLYDGVNSTSTTLAATANVVNSVYTLANTAYYNSISSSGTLTSNYKVQEYVANTGQTTFVVTNGYTKDYISVYVNGVLLDTTDYTALDGSHVILNTPATSGDNVSIAKWYFDNGIYLSAIQHYDQFVATSNQSLYTANTNYTPGYIKVFRNGILLGDQDYSATNGANVTLSTAASANDIVVLHYWGATALNTTPVYVIANNALETANAALSGVYGKMTDLQYANLTSNTVTTSANTANQVLDIFSTSSYRSVKYQVQVTSGSNYQVSELMLIHNNTNAYVSEYGLVTTNSSLMNYDADISGGNVRVLISPVNNINTIKFVKTSIVV